VESHSIVCKKYGITSISNFIGQDKTVFLRVDFNVPVDINHSIADDFRIKSSIQTIEFLLEQNATVIIVSHFGDPVTPSDKINLSFSNIIDEISRILNCEIQLIRSQNLTEVASAVENFKSIKKCGDRQLLMLDNIRFFPEEISNSEDFAHKILETLKIDAYINDAFPVCHRRHMSVVAIPKIIKEKYAGFSLLHELSMIEQIIGHAFRSQSIITAIIGGKKVKTKISLLQNLAKKVQNIIIVGGMANTFLKALGYNIGNSFYEHEMLDIASQIMRQSKVLLPSDVICKSLNNEIKICAINEDIDGEICDIGPETNKLIDRVISQSEFVIWNGPAGIFEDKRFAEGTKRIAQSLASNKCATIVGGGDTVSAIDSNMRLKIDHISNGGGAFITLLEGDILPGISALNIRSDITLIK
jgi:3-phosphoglycerate kinase